MPFRVLNMLLLVAGAVGAGGCEVLGVGDGAERELERHRDRWVSLAMTSYEYVLSRQCFCARTFTGSVRVRVENGIVTSRVFDNANDSIRGEPGDAFPTVEGLFDVIGEAYDRDAHRVDVTFDPETGVPLNVYIDYDENILDEELGFEVRTLPVSLP